MAAAAPAPMVVSSWVMVVSCPPFIAAFCRSAWCGGYAYPGVLCSKCQGAVRSIPRVAPPAPNTAPQHHNHFYHYYCTTAPVSQVVSRPQWPGVQTHSAGRHWLLISCFFYPQVHDFAYYTPLIFTDFLPIVILFALDCILQNLYGFARL